jgi:glycosyltransferase involved in cell wall biosynthesis
MEKNKIALFHPWIKSRGGAEKVVLEMLQKSKHEIDLYTWVYDKDNTFKEFQEYDVHILAPKFAEKIARKYIMRGMFLLASFLKKIPLEKYDKFLISTSGVGEFITFRNYKKDKTYAYVHTPLREANKKIIGWNIKNRHKNPFKKLFYLFFVKVYNFFERKAWKKIDFVVFNSELSKQRAEEKKILKDKKNKIIYPPIDFSRFDKIKNNKGNSFVYISRLNPPKRQDVLIEAWNNFSKDKENYKLILVGNIDNQKYYSKLVKLSKENKTIEIKTDVSNEEIEKILSHSLAGFFLGYQEDFGIVPLEILSSGKHLLATDEGGYVKVIEKHPRYYKINEKHSNKDMVKEIEEQIKKFVKGKKTKKKGKIITGNFIKEIDEVLEE